MFPDSFGIAYSLEISSPKSMLDRGITQDGSLKTLQSISYSTIPWPLWEDDHTGLIHRGPADPKSELQTISRSLHQVPLTQVLLCMGEAPRLKMLASQGIPVEIQILVSRRLSLSE